MSKILPIAIISLAAFLRLYALGEFPYFYDESVHVVITRSLLSGSYSYNPAFHGPLQFYTYAAFAKAFGDSEFAFRLAPALLGVALVAAVMLYRRYVGDKAYVAAFFVAISPVIVNYSRFCREDAFQLLFVALAVYFLLLYLEREKGWNEVKLDASFVYAVLFGVFLALFACVKETFYVFAVFFIVYVSFHARKVRLFDLLAFLAVFLLIYSALYSVFFTQPQVLTNFSSFPAVAAAEYWLEQHSIARIGGPFYYFVPLLFLYDLPVLLLALITSYKILRNLRNEGDFSKLFLFLFVATFLFHSYMQEKLPWLVVHIEFPMYVLAAMSVGNRKVFALTSAFLLYGCVALNFFNPVNPAEPALYLPTQFEFKDFVSEVAEKRVAVVMELGEAYPLLTYLKRPAYFYDPRLVGDSYDVVVTNSTNYLLLAGKLDWKREEVVVRCWTFLSEATAEKVVRFLIFREPMGNVYCMNHTVFFTIQHDWWDRWKRFTFESDKKFDNNPK